MSLAGRAVFSGEEDAAAAVIGETDRSAERARFKDNAATMGATMRRGLALPIVSAAVLAPCLWHRHLEAGDLASHTYNAWLVDLASRGEAPGLYLAHPWTNVLFDVALTGLGRLFGFIVAERIAACAAVLVLFWGAFAFVGSTSRRARPPWLLAPCLAMVAYGWTFEMGFMNYYVSVGLAFAALAMFVRHRGSRRRLYALALAPLAGLAHPLGLVVLGAASLYVFLSERLCARRLRLVFVAYAAGLVALRLVLTERYEVRWPPPPVYGFNGADQLLLFGDRYRGPSYALGALALAYVLFDLFARRRDADLAGSYRLPLHLYGLAILAAALLPSFVHAPDDRGAPASFLVERLTLVTAVLGCAVLAAMRPRRWHAVGFAAVAAWFFLLLYRDTGVLDRMESDIDRFAATLPARARVVATLWPFLGGRLLAHHMVDRACIGRCYSYGNYEASSGQFRLRAARANPVVVADPAAASAMMFGEYVALPQELPMFEIYQCSADLERVCMRQLAAGEPNGLYGVRFQH